MWLLIHTVCWVWRTKSVETGISWRTRSTSWLPIPCAIKIIEHPNIKHQPVESYCIMIIVSGWGTTAHSFMMIRSMLMWPVVAPCSMSRPWRWHLSEFWLWKTLCFKAYQIFRGNIFSLMAISHFTLSPTNICKYIHISDSGWDEKDCRYDQCMFFSRLWFHQYCLKLGYKSLKPPHIVVIIIANYFFNHGANWIDACVSNRKGILHGNII